MNSTGEAFYAVGVGIILIPIVGWIVRGFALLHTRVARALLGPDPAARVQQLEQTRAGAVDAAQEELNRIERDLHDGAQARLVALAMDLGMAEKKLDENPEESRELVGEAREQALQTLQELRDLVRGIAPSILRDRGLSAALGSLAARRTPPILLDIEVGEPRPSACGRDRRVLRRRRGDRQRRQARRTRRTSPCVSRRDAEFLYVTVEDDGPGGARLDSRRRHRRTRQARRGAGRQAPGREPARRTDDRERRDPVRVVIAEDLALLRDGLTRLLRDSGFEVVAAVDDGEKLVRAVEEHRPDVAIVDVRLPPTFTDEGIRAALRAREVVDGVPVLILSQYVEQTYAQELLADGRGGVGYLLKDRVANPDEFVAAVTRVAEGGTALDPEAVGAAVRPPPRRPARRAHPARARGARADGGGPLERRHRPRARGHRRRRREARVEHLRQARPAAVGRRPPARARRPRVHARVTPQLPAAGLLLATVIVVATTNTFSGAALDRCGEHRTDADWIAERLNDPEARALVIGREGPWLDEQRAVARPDRRTPSCVDPVFLGIRDGRPYFAGRCRPTTSTLPGGPAGLREVVTRVSHADAGLLGLRHRRGRLARPPPLLRELRHADRRHRGRPRAQVPELRRASTTRAPTPS